MTNLQNGIYAEIKTNKGNIVVELYYEKTPATVGNFVALAEGNMPNKYKKQGEPYYDGLKFHRVISNFMIQGGCPLGTGTGEPGYRFDDEFNKDLTHNVAGILSMANAGPGTNGSQFFITHTATPWLDGKHTVFGKVVSGQEVVDSVVQGDVMKKVTIIRVGEQANNWNALKAFNDFVDEKELCLKKQQEEEENKIRSLTQGFEKTQSGLFYNIVEKGNGKKAIAGKPVVVHYTGMLTDSTVFDSSYSRNEPITFNVGVGQVIAGWDEGILLLQEGDKARFVIPSHLGYGTRGAGGVIPPNATLIFDVELIKVN